jgi:hypothetical protein
LVTVDPPRTAYVDARPNDGVICDAALAVTTMAGARPGASRSKARIGARSDRRILIAE